MFEFEFKDDKGRTIRPNQIGQHIRKSLEGQLQSILQQQAIELASQLGLSSVRCPVHGTTARNWRLVPKSPGSSQHHLSYDECCQSLVAVIDQISPK